MRRSFPLVVGSIGLVLAACSDQGPQTSTIAPKIARSLQTGPHFHFLPPLVRNERNTGAFNPNMAPIVEICILTGENGDCTADPVIRFSRYTPGPFGELITVGGQYLVNWNTGQYGIPDHTFLRLTVRTAEDGGTVLGFTDLWMARANELRDAPLGTIGVANGSTVPIKFRIESGALCSDTSSCFEGHMTSAGGIFKTNDGTAGLLVPPGAIDPGVVVSLMIERFRPSDSEPCLPVEDEQFEGCFRYVTEPHIERFNLEVTIGQCLDEAGQEVYDELQLWKWDEESSESLIALPLRDASGFIECPEDLAFENLNKSGLLATGLKLFQPIKSIFSVKSAYAAPMRAGPPPIGGGADDLSRVGPRRTNNQFLSAFFLPEIGQAIEAGNVEGLKPVVSVCQVVNETCGEPIFSVSATEANEGEEYRATWPTPESLSPNNSYRINVTLGRRILGSVSVFSLEGGQFQAGNLVFSAGDDVLVRFKLFESEIQ